MVFSIKKEIYDKYRDNIITFLNGHNFVFDNKDYYYTYKGDNYNVDLVLLDFKENVLFTFTIYLNELDLKKENKRELKTIKAMIKTIERTITNI